MKDNYSTSALRAFLRWRTASVLLRSDLNDGPYVRLPTADQVPYNGEYDDTAESDRAEVHGLRSDLDR